MLIISVPIREGRLCHLGWIALVIRERDKTLAFHVDKLGFDLVEDLPVRTGETLGNNPPARRNRLQTYPSSNPEISRAPWMTRTMSTQSPFTRYSTK
jgi:hypothetical protein